MVFTAEQQVEVNRLIDESYTKAYTKAGEKYSDEKSEAVALAVANAVSGHEASMAEANKQIEDLKAKGVSVDTSATDDRIAKLEAHLKTEKEKGITGTLESLAAKNNAIDPVQAAVLMRLQTKTDDSGNLVVVNTSGTPRNNDDNKPMTLDELGKEFFTANTHHVKASNASGAGSKGNTGVDPGATKTITRADFMKLSPALQSKAALDNSTTIID